MGHYVAEEGFRALLEKLPEDLVRQPVDRIRQFFYAVCDPFSALNNKHGQRIPTLIPQKNVQVATGVCGSAYQSASRLLDHGRLGILRVPKGKAVEVLRPTAGELLELMELRTFLETKAACQLHRDEAAKALWQAEVESIFAELETQWQHLTSLCCGHESGHNIGTYVAHWAASEYHWRLDTQLHAQVFLATQQQVSADTVKLVRDKMRLVSSFRHVICSRTEGAAEEHRAWLDAIRAPYTGSESEARVRAETRRHLEAAQAQLLSALQRR